MSPSSSPPVVPPGSSPEGVLRPETAHLRNRVPGSRPQRASLPALPCRLVAAARAAPAGRAGRSLHAGRAAAGSPPSPSPAPPRGRGPPAQPAPRARFSPPVRRSPPGAPGALSIAALDPPPALDPRLPPEALQTWGLSFPGSEWACRAQRGRERHLPRGRAGVGGTCPRSGFRDSRLAAVTPSGPGALRSRAAYGPAPTAPASGPGRTVPVLPPDLPPPRGPAGSPAAARTPTLAARPPGARRDLGGGGQSPAGRGGAGPSDVSGQPGLEA